MFDVLAQDLLTKIQAIPALATSTGLDLIGDTPDPGGAKIVPPAAWIIGPKSAKNTADLAASMPTVSAPINMLAQYVVGLYLGSSSQISEQLPLLKAVIKAVHGTDSPTGMRWIWESLDRAATNPGVNVYAISFAVNSTF